MGGMLTIVAMVAALEKSNLGSLRAIQHKDQFGNVISMFFDSVLVECANASYSGP